MSAFGKFLYVLGIFGGGLIWLGTTAAFFARGDILLALLSLFFPPADLILPFFISPLLGIAALGSVACLFLGSVLAEDET